MPFYSGKGSGVVFTSETRPGTILYLTANQWTLEIKDEAINVTNIKPMRDNNILEPDLKAFPAWEKYGMPMEKLNGGMRETTLSVHGFLFLDNTISVNDGPRYPIINEKGKIELEFVDVNNKKRILFTMNSVVVISTKFYTSVTACVEYDIEFQPLTYEVDYMAHPKAK